MKQAKENKILKLDYLQINVASSNKIRSLSFALLAHLVYSHPKKLGHLNKEA